MDVLYTDESWKSEWKQNQLKDTKTLRKSEENCTFTGFSTASDSFQVINYYLIKTKLLITAALSFPSHIFRLFSQVYREHGNAKTLFLIF